VDFYLVVSTPLRRSGMAQSQRSRTNQIRQSLFAAEGPESHLSCL